MTISQTNSFIAYSDSKSIFLKNINSSNIINLTENPPSLKKICKKGIFNLEFPTDESRLLIGSYRKLITFNLESNEVEELYNAPHLTYWMKWSQKGGQVLLLAGLPNWERQRNTSRSFPN